MTSYPYPQNNNVPLRDAVPTPLPQGEGQLHDGLSSFVIPASPKLQQLADRQIETKARQALALMGENPTAEQWRMILAPTTSTCVIAGAGSGKSTTLILRIIVVHKLLTIPLDELHVFSFTRLSTEEFRQKLTTKLITWAEKVEHKQLTNQHKSEIAVSARRAVSTFHSVVTQLSSEVLPGGNALTQFFDLLGSTIKNEEERSNYNPFVSGNLSHEQKHLLNLAHTYAFQSSALYRSAITALIVEQDKQLWRRAENAGKQEEQFEQWRWNQTTRQEREYHGFTPKGEYLPSQQFPDSRGYRYIDPYRAAVANRLYELQIPFQPLAEFRVHCPIPRGVPGDFYASFKIGQHFFLHVERYKYAGAGKGDEYGLSFHERDRRSLIALYSERNDTHQILNWDDFDISDKVPVLNTKGDFKLTRWLHTQGYAITTENAPFVRLQLPGDLHQSHIAELLYQEGAFIESLGLEVEHLRMPVGLDLISQNIALALPPFWRAFQETLEQRNMLRFHDVLTRLRDPQTLESVYKRLKHLHHLFIDEFQDISPELVDWLAKTTQVHIKRGEEVSITAIGDDYQSIYGWRGSHPTFLMHFERYFPSRSTGHIVLTTNFRSRQPIIDAAEAVLTTVAQKIAKHGVSSFQQREGSRIDPVRLLEAPLSWSSSSSETDIWESFCAYIAKLLHELEQQGRLARLIDDRQTLKVFLLARKNSTRGSIPKTDPLTKHLLARLRQERVTQFRRIEVSRGTFHSAKGLEADVVLLLDDSLPPEQHPLRNHVFNQVGLFGQDRGSYTQTMEDEARRLAYVALTRARLACMWVPLTIGQREGGDVSSTKGNGQVEASISAQGSFVLVKNYLQTVGRT